MNPRQIYEFAKYESAKKTPLGVTIGVALGIALTLAFLFLLSSQYFYNLYYRFKNIDPTEAQKIGNWKLPDKDYIATNLGQIVIDNQEIAMAEALDKKSGTKFMFFKTVIAESGFLRAKEDRENRILENYNLNDFYIKSSDKVEKYGEKIGYRVVGWNAERNARAGIIASIDCQAAAGSVNTVFAVAVNSIAKFDNARALGLIETMECGLDKAFHFGGENNLDKIDSDKDGLPDKVEKMLGTDPYKDDTDGDGYNDFDEIKNGYNPMVPRPWDKYTPEEFEKVKRDIRYVSEDVYQKLWGGN